MTNRTQDSFPLDGLPDLLRSAEVGVWEIDTATGTFLCSPTFTRMTGIEPGVSIQEFRHCLVAPGDAERMQALFAACFEGKPDRYRGRFLLRNGGGEARRGEECAAVIRLNADGSPARLAGMLRDITRVKNSAGLSRVRQSQEEPRKQSRLFQAINHVPVGLAGAVPEAFDDAVRDAMAMIGEAADVDRLRVWRNYDDNGEPCAREIYQWTKDPRWDMPLVERISHQHIPFWWNTMEQGKVVNAHAGEMPEAEQNELEKNSVLSILAVPIFSQDAFWGGIGFDDCTVGRKFTDSEEKLLQSGGNIIISALLRNEMTASLIEAREQAIASAKAKSEFLSRMSHEIRTPMNAIIGMGAVARRTDDLEKIGDCLRKIDASSRQLLGIINDVLDMSKIEADKFAINSAAFDFEKMLQNIFSVIQVKFCEKNQEFKYDIESIFTRKMISDELRLSQVLLNLLSNAVKFTPEGGTIIMRLRERNRTEAGSTLHVEIIDNGIGIPEEYQARLFTSFEQADGGITRQFGGTGLGLAISKKIVTLMGGDIWVKSAQGVGSSFMFEIPVGWGEPLRADGTPAERKRSLRALVVDDDSDILEYMGILLDGFSIRADTAADPMRAIDLVVRNESAGTPYDVILADWNMPVMDGVETALELKRISSENLFIIMTSLTDWGDVEREAGMSGVTRFLQKPILPSALYNALARHGGHGMEPPSPGDAPRKNWAGRNILLAEDIEINREIVINLLEDTGVYIDMARDGVEAVDIFRGNPGKYDLILMDVQMPNLDGIAATRQIRALDVPGSADVPIVAMTANAFKGDEEECLAAGMTGYLAKPVDVKKLFATLTAILDAPAGGKGSAAG